MSYTYTGSGGAGEGGIGRCHDTYTGSKGMGMSGEKLDSW